MINHCVLITQIFYKCSSNNVFITNYIKFYILFIVLSNAVANLSQIF